MVDLFAFHLNEILAYRVWKLARAPTTQTDALAEFFKVSSGCQKSFSVGGTTQQVHRFLPSVPVVQAYHDHGLVTASGDDDGGMVVYNIIYRACQVFACCGVVERFHMYIIACNYSRARLTTQTDSLASSTTLNSSLTRDKPCNKR